MGITIVPIVIGLTQLVKDTKLVSTKYLKFIAIVIALGLAGTQILITQGSADFLPHLLEFLEVNYPMIIAGVATPHIYDAAKEISAAKKP